jgi:hypothetical protein
MKYSDKYLKKSIRHSLNETLKDKADMLYGKIKEMEIEEAFGDEKGMGDNTPFLPKGTRFRKFNSGEKFDDLEDKYGDTGGRTRKREFEDMLKGFEDEIEDDGDDDEDIFLDLEGGDDDLVTEGRLCEECGVGKMNEGECNECGYSKLNERSHDLNRKNKFDYVESRQLKGNQRNLDKNKNGKLDSEDFKLLRKGKHREETKEGKKFPDLTGDGKVTRKDILKGRGVKLGKKKVEESIEYRIKDNNGDIIRLNENDMINLIENIISEQNVKLKSLGKPKGLMTYEKAHRESGKENKDYMTSLGKKMKDYLKDGSKGKYEMNPKTFPVGNGELAKMSKKAFKMTDDLEDFNYEIAGLNIPTPDAIDFNDEWLDKLYKGDSTTGNAPGGNALDSDANERFNKIRKKNTLKKIKDQSYKRTPQPIFNEKPGDGIGKGVNIKLETIDEKRINVLNEEFDRMKDLFSYNRKTQ